MKRGEILVTIEWLNGLLGLPLNCTIRAVEYDAWRHCIRIAVDGAEMPDTPPGCDAPVVDKRGFS